jgi:hypothetical protein
MRYLIISLTCLGLLVGCNKPPQNDAASEKSDKFVPAWLPPSTQTIYSSRDGGLAKLKAKATEAEFADAAKNLKAVPHSEDAEFASNLAALKWQEETAKGWDPSPSIEKTLICHRLNFWEMLKYERGYLYYQVLDVDR